MDSTNINLDNASSSKEANESESVVLRQENEENKENITIVYFDATSSREINKHIDMLREINDYALIYTDINECVARVQAIKKEKIIFITNAESLENVLFHIENIRQIDGIFILSSKINMSDQFKDKFTGIFSNVDDMIIAIRKHMQIVQEQLHSFSFYRRYQRYIRKLTERSADFVWFHVFKYVIARLPHDEDAKQEMLHASRHYYRNNSQEIKRIDEFERIYQSEDAIKWYTKNSFVYRLLNKALRTEDVEQMYTFRYFIQDLYIALTKKHKLFKDFGEPVTVYHGIRLTQSEFDELIKDEQQLISMNGYLSTSLTRQVAEVYAGAPTSTSDKLSILLEIECNVEKLGDTVIFADIASESNFKDENEILFDIGATLQLIDKPKQNDNGVWHLKMVATDEGRTVVRKYIDDHIELSTEISPKIMYGVLLYNMGKYDASLSFFNTLLTNPDGEYIVLIHVHIARGFGIRNDKIQEWKHYEIAYKLLLEIEPKRIEDEARVLIHMGTFCFDRYENDRALEYFTHALHLFKQVYGNNNVEVARALLCMGGCYEHKGNYEQAIDYYNQALKIHEQCENPNHLIECQAFIAIGNAYCLQRKYADALVQFRRALDLRTRTLPEYHSDIAGCLSLIGRTLGEMDNPSEGLLYSMQALNMYNKTLPETELIEKSSVLVDIGIAFSSVGVNKLGLDYFHQALAMKRKSLPRSHPDFVAIFENMALNYSYLNKHLLALKFIFKARRLAKRIKSLDHPSMASLLKVLAIVYANMGLYKRAMHYMSKAKKILKKNSCNTDLNWIDVNRQMIRIKKKIYSKKSNIQNRKVWKKRNLKITRYINFLSISAGVNSNFDSSA